MRVHIGILVGSLLVISGFFFGWVGLDTGSASFSISGWEMARVAKQSGAQYYLIYLLPVGATVAAYFALKDPKRAAQVGTWVGGGFLAWAVFEVARILWTTTFVGLWLSLLGASVLFGMGLYTSRLAKLRSRTPTS